MNAIQTRYQERRELREDIMRVLYLEEENRGVKDTTFLLEVVGAISGYLKQRIRNAPRHETPKEEAFFLEKILYPVQGFARTPTEEDAILAEFLIKVTERATLPFRVRLQEEEFYHPEEVLYAPSPISQPPTP